MAVGNGIRCADRPREPRRGVDPGFGGRRLRAHRRVARARRCAPARLRRSHCWRSRFRRAAGSRLRRRPSGRSRWWRSACCWPCRGGGGCCVSRSRSMPSGRSRRTWSLRRPAATSRRLATFLAAPIAALALWPDRAAAAGARSAAVAVPGVARPGAGPDDGCRRPVGGEGLLRPLALVPRPPERSAVPDRDPVHGLSLGGIRGRDQVPDRPRLGAPARHQVQPALLRRAPDGGALRRLAASRRDPVRRARRTRRWTTRRGPKRR